MKRKSKRPAGEQCANCGYSFPKGVPDAYCPQCGQDNAEHKTTFWHWIMEFIEGIFHVDGKFWITLRYLLLKPGQASVEYTAGKRARFMPPVRLYLFVSFVFFILLAGQTPPLKSKYHGANEEFLDAEWTSVHINALGENEIELNGTGITRRELYQAYAAGTQALDSLFTARQVSENTTLPDGFLRQLAKIDIEGPAALQQKIMKALTLCVFVLMPVYALLLLMLFRKRRPFYSDHFVFSIHAHTVLFILLSLSFILLQSAPAWVDYVVLAGMAIFHLMAVKRFYGQSLLWTGIKYIISSVLYIALLVVLLIGSVFASLMLV